MEIYRTVQAGKERERMTPEEAIEMLRGMQNKKVDYAELVCAPAFASGYKYVYPEPEDYAIEEAISALKEIQQYREIGTVEECREAVEKQKPKEPTVLKQQHSDFYNCPKCGRNLILKCGTDWFGGQHYKSCPNCGQAIQWDENLEGMEDE